MKIIISNQSELPIYAQIREQLKLYEDDAAEQLLRELIEEIG